MRTSPFRMLLLTAIVLVIACASTTPSGVDRTPLQTAEITYVQGSVFYEAAMTSIQQLRAQRLVTDAQWTQVDRAQQIVRQYSGQYSELLATWRETGTKPEQFDTIERIVERAIEDVTRVLVEVQR